MLTAEQIKNNISNYKVENGIVIDKSNNQPVQDEDKVLEVKSSILLYRESKESYQSDIQQFGKTNKSQDEYINKTMEKFGVNNEQNTYGVNKLINSILSSNGHYEENMSGSDLQNSKFSILVEPKKDYGISYLKMKFRERGLDIENLNINQDLSELQKNGLSKVIIDFKINKYEKQPIQEKKEENINLNNDISQPLYQHPMANELNELEKQKQIAKQNGDDVAYNYAQSNIERIIKENRAQVSPEQWNSMSIDERKSFIQTKMREAKILNDKDDFDYWNANLNQLTTPEPIIEKKEDKQHNTPDNNLTSTSLDFSIMINQLKNQNIQISSDYKEMLSDGYIDDEELANLIKRTNDLSDTAELIKSMVTDKKQEMMIDSIIETINKEQMKMKTMQRGIEETSHGFGM